MECAFKFGKKYSLFLKILEAMACVLKTPVIVPGTPSRQLGGAAYTVCYVTFEPLWNNFYFIISNNPKLLFSKSSIIWEEIHLLPINLQNHCP